MQKSQIGVKFSRKDVQRSLLSNGVNLCNIHGRTTRFLRILYQQNLVSLDQKGQRQYEMEEGYWTPEIYRQETVIKLLSYKSMLPFMKKGKMIQRAEVKTTEDYFQPLKSNGVYPAGFQKHLFLSSHYLSFEWKCLSCYLMLVSPSEFGSRQCVLKFQRNTQRGIMPQDGFYPEYNPYQIQMILMMKFGTLELMRFLYFDLMLSVVVT